MRQVSVLVAITLCILVVASLTACIDHPILREVVGIDSAGALTPYGGPFETELIKTAWNERFPPGMSIEEVRAILPLSIQTPYWNVQDYDNGRIWVSSWQIEWPFMCGVDIEMSFEDGKLVSNTVRGGCTGP